MPSRSIGCSPSWAPSKRRADEDSGEADARVGVRHGGGDHARDLAAARGAGVSGARCVGSSFSRVPRRALRVSTQIPLFTLHSTHFHAPERLRGLGRRWPRATFSTLINDRAARLPPQITHRHTHTTHSIIDGTRDWARDGSDRAAQDVHTAWPPAPLHSPRTPHQQNCHRVPAKAPACAVHCASHSRRAIIPHARSLRPPPRRHIPHPHPTRARHPTEV